MFLSISGKLISKKGKEKKKIQVLVLFLCSLIYKVRRVIGGSLSNSSQFQITKILFKHIWTGDNGDYFLDRMMTVFLHANTHVSSKQEGWYELSIEENGPRWLDNTSKQSWEGPKRSLNKMIFRWKEWPMNLINWESRLSSLTVHWLGTW